MVDDRCVAESWCLAWTYGSSGFLRQGRSLDGFSRRVEADRRGLGHCLELALPHSRARVSPVASAAATCGDARRVAYFVVQEGKLQVSFVGVYHVEGVRSQHRNVGRVLSGFKRRHPDLLAEVHKAPRRAGRKGGMDEWVATERVLRRLHAKP
mgnify:CR=1 FL=1